VASAKIEPEPIPISIDGLLITFTDGNISKKVDAIVQINDILTHSDTSTLFLDL
jgi:hypothetical protein